MRNSLGIWAFGPAVTRFVPPGYHHEVTGESMVDRTRRVAEGLHDLLDGLEYHYPGEVDEDHVDAILGVLREYDMDLPVIASGLHPDPTYALGSLINPDPRLRRQAVETNLRAVDLCARIGASFIIWPGAEGYNYPFQRRYAETWARFIDGIAEITAHAAERGVKIHLEHKNSEPAMKVLMRNIGMTLHVIQKVRERGVDTSRLLVNMDWQHLIMNGETLAEYAEVLAAEGKLGHQHANDGWGAFDDDNVVGTNFFMQTLELALTLQDVGYGANGEILGYDLYPYTEDQVAAVRRAILQWEFIWELAGRIDRAALDKARASADALGGQKAVYRVLGLDEGFEAEVVRRRLERRAARA
ncbi:MAG TPA: sugar phosphate isomerase/epimerase family protein [Candidatus Dormibacteraeota bacterium]